MSIIKFLELVRAVGVRDPIIDFGGFFPGWVKADKIRNLCGQNLVKWELNSDYGLITSERCVTATRLDADAHPNVDGKCAEWILRLSGIRAMGNGAWLLS